MNEQISTSIEDTMTGIEAIVGLAELRQRSPAGETQVNDNGLLAKTGTAPVERLMREAESGFVPAEQPSHRQPTGDSQLQADAESAPGERQIIRRKAMHERMRRRKLRARRSRRSSSGPRVTLF